MKRFASPAAFSLVELLVALSLALLVGGILLTAWIALRQSVFATGEFATNTVVGNRLQDYVARDLRRAVRVGLRASGSTSKLTNFAPLGINETQVLSINIPDYYLSNAPDNARGSAFKTGRYPRSTLNAGFAYNASGVAALNGVVPWAEAVTAQGTTLWPRFAPPAAGGGEIEIRYYRARRSTLDGTACFFRAEHLPSSATPICPPEEIAEQVTANGSTTSLLLSGSDNGKRFRIETHFVPRYRRTNLQTSGTEQYLDVKLRNARRD